MLKELPIYNTYRDEKLNLFRTNCQLVQLPKLIKLYIKFPLESETFLLNLAKSFIDLVKRQSKIENYL